MNVLVNFSGKNFEESRFKLNKSALKFGIDQVKTFDESDLFNTEFYRQHILILSAPKGLGYWLWKPYFIQKALLNSAEGDLIIYSDAGIEIVSNLNPLINLCQKNGIVLFANGNLKNRYWIKRDCFILMDCDDSRYWNGSQVDAAFCLFRNIAPVRDFVKKWLEYCCDERIISDKSNVLGKKNFFGFHVHRHDQAVLSLMAIIWNLELYRQPSQFGNHYKAPEYRVPGEFNCVSQYKLRQVGYYASNPYYNSPFFQLLDHHRTKADKIKLEKLSIPQKIFKSGKRRMKKIIKLLTRQ